MRRSPVRLTKQPITKRVGALLIVTGILISLYPAFTMLYGRYRQDALFRTAEKKMMYEREKANLNSAQSKKVMLSTPIGQSGPWPLTKIVIPKLGVEQFIQEGIDADILTQSPGHYPKTRNPGQPGWCAIAGHRITFSAPFDRLDEMNRGDQVILETAEARFVYLIDSIEIVRDDANLDLEMTRTDKPHVLLTTCEPKTGSSHRLIASGTLAAYPASRYVVPTAK